MWKLFFGDDTRKLAEKIADMQFMDRIAQDEDFMERFLLKYAWLLPQCEAAVTFKDEDHTHIMDLASVCLTPKLLRMCSYLSTLHVGATGVIGYVMAGCFVQRLVLSSSMYTSVVVFVYPTVDNVQSVHIVHVVNLPIVLPSNRST